MTVHPLYSVRTEILFKSIHPLIMQVVDVTQSLSGIYDIVDPVSLEGLTTQQLPLFERQWNALLTNVDIALWVKVFQGFSLCLKLFLKEEK